MADWWELKREVLRIGQQLRTVPEAVWEPFARARHDKIVNKGLPVYAGDMPFGPKIALVLMYQPNTLCQSLVHMCEHLKNNGFAIQIVSNMPLKSATYSALKPVVWQIVERPNFGYDFGGYRDGLRLLSQHPQASDIDRLLIVNDSIWYPLHAGDDLLDQLEGLDVDIAGTNMRHRGTADFLESYLYLIRGSALRHPAFRAFWNQLKITSNKYNVIRRGERGFSAAMQGAGLSMRGLYDAQDFMARLAQQSNDFLRKTLTYASQHLQNYAVLKKSNDHVSRIWRKAVLRAVAKGDLPAPLDVVLRELHGTAKGH